MATQVKIRTAGRRLFCRDAEHYSSRDGCVGVIDRGARYVVASVPPSDPRNDEGKWVHANLCVPRARRYHDTRDSVPAEAS